jgi:hypothetical protein
VLTRLRTLHVGFNLLTDAAIPPGLAALESLQVGPWPLPLRQAPAQAEAARSAVGCGWCTRSRAVPNLPVGAQQEALLDLLAGP